MIDPYALLLCRCMCVLSGELSGLFLVPNQSPRKYAGRCVVLQTRRARGRAARGTPLAPHWTAC